MAPHKRLLAAKALALFVFLPLLILSACGGTGGGGTVNGTTPIQRHDYRWRKKDVEAQLLTEMYHCS